MIEQKCKICGKTNDLFKLTLEADDGEKFIVPVCGSCWDVIAGIADRVVSQRLEKIEKKIAELDKALYRAATLAAGESLG